METDRPHRSNSSNNNNSSTNSGGNNSANELFICFTSRLSSSSSMKIPSKSILSPGRARDSSQISLSNSLSRRLRSNGSMKGGQASPMFPTTGKKRGCAFENPEPSSPKVTCIGQVRVKTKKQGRKMRSRSKRRAGEVSFRRIEQTTTTTNTGSEASNCQNYSQEERQQEGLPQRNQRWVHLPVTICEALRAFGAEFNCFLPCRSSCTAGEKVNQDSTAGSSKSSSSCGAVFARWLVAVEEGDGKEREIELVVGEEEEEAEGSCDERRKSYRRHVFDEIEFNEENFGGGNEGLKQEEARVSICIPPKNALLLMRCRSDPVKMAALANKFWEPSLPNEEYEVEEKEEECEGNGRGEEKEAIQEKQAKVVEDNKEELIVEKVLSCEAIEEEHHQIQENNTSAAALEEEEINTDNVVKEDHSVEEEEEEDEERPEIEEAIPVNEEIADLEISDGNDNGGNLIQEDNVEQQEEEEEKQDFSEDIESSIQTDQESEVVQELQDQEPEPAPPESGVLEELPAEEEVEEEETPVKTWEEEEEGGGEAETVNHERPDSEDPETQQGQTGFKSKDRESQPLLPDCLLLMMCEPKLSMEVSKETWVCSTDFIRWLPEDTRPVKQKNGGHEPKKRVNMDVNPPPIQNSIQQQPPRSSCSYPAPPPARAGGAESMATAIEKKLIASKAYEPFVLTRCKSEPMRTAAKLAPDSCFWKNRKVELHRPATLGVGAAGVGF